MADAIGPCSTLPGAVHKCPMEATCDTSGHGDRPAYRRVQGETDSFGAELIDMCHECWDAHKVVVAEEDTSGCCDWCKQHKPALRKRRDFEEGSAGRVYDVCSDCIKAENERLSEELGDDEGWHVPYDDYTDDYDEDDIPYIEGDD